MTPRLLSAALLLPLFRLSAAEEAFPPQPLVQALSAAEELKTFQLPPGYRLELVLEEPQIKEPVLTVFDGDGRMFIAEMLTYMQDIEGQNQLTNESRVSLHWSSKGDGVYDQHTVFADKLKLPRILLPLGKGQVVIGETDTLDLHLHTDTDGDGKADKKEPWFIGGPRGGNLEHQPSGAIWALDNGIYTTYNAYRLRWTPTGVIKEQTAGNSGQWGLGQDDHGNAYFISGGGEHGPQSWQVPTVYGNLNPKGQIVEGFKEVFPLVGRADVQGGHSRHRPDGTLNHFTAASGVAVYRGDRLPGELYGSVFVGEPVGRLVRQATTKKQGALTVLSNPFQEKQSEFLRSTDLCFRPLWFNSAPDGTLYITDMYRGIIQEGNWVRPGSYLRKVVEQYRFDLITDRGRIWRLMHHTTKLGPQPKMFSETPTQLTAHLAHPNGWWRDEAQKLIILSQDKTTIPTLKTMATTHPNYLARLHALWTLDGLAAADGTLIRTALKDTHPQIRIAGIRIAERQDHKTDPTLKTQILTLATDPDPSVTLQVALSARALKWPEATPLLTTLSDKSNQGTWEIANAILNPPGNKTITAKTQLEKTLLKKGEENFKTLCSTCHGPDGKGMPMPGGQPGQMLAPSFAASKTINGHKDGPIRIMLSGLTGDIDGKKYEGLMVAMANNNDEWIASVLSYIRNSFGNKAGFVYKEDVARLRAATKDRTQPYTIQELRALLPKTLPRKDWKLTASHNPTNCSAMLDGKTDTRYTTNASQTPGMWLQIELPTQQPLTSITLDCAPSPNDYPRGYTVELSTDGQTWTKIAQGTGNTPTTEINFPETKAKHVKITQTGSVNGLFWSIHELNLTSTP